ncbi:MAG: hypothetical protein K9K81_11020 [Desulfobacteraceae bacterium]|nr:hypothetical protein [Desulfobacteraceae bacterium]
MKPFSATCTKTMKAGDAVAFQRGVTYTWRWPTDQEEEGFDCEYVFRSDLSDRHYMTHGDVEEYF